MRSIALGRLGGAGRPSASKRQRLSFAPSVGDDDSSQEGPAGGGGGGSARGSMAGTPARGGSQLSQGPSQSQETHWGASQRGASQKSGGASQALASARASQEAAAAAAEMAGAVVSRLVEGDLDALL